MTGGGWDVVRRPEEEVKPPLVCCHGLNPILMLVETWALISESTINTWLTTFNGTQRILFFVPYRKDFVNCLCLYCNIISHVKQQWHRFWQRSHRIVSAACCLTVIDSSSAECILLLSTYPNCIWSWPSALLRLGKPPIEMDNLRLESCLNYAPSMMLSQPQHHQQESFIRHSSALQDKPSVKLSTHHVGNTI